FLAGLRATSAAAGATPRFSAAAAVDFVRAGFDDPSAGAAARNWAPPTPPTAAADLSALAVRTDESVVTFAVTYRDDAAVDVDSIDGGDVVLVAAKGGRALTAELVSVATADDGRTAVATYRAVAPGPVWRARDAGTYRVRVIEGQVRDADGFTVEPGVVGEGELAVTVVPPPPTVKKVKLVRGKRDLPDQLVVALSADLTGAPASGALELVPYLPPAKPPADGSTAEVPAAPVPLDLSAASVTYDPAKRTLTWTFPQLPAGRLPAGAYTLTLEATGVTSTDGKTLDGNADGLAGDAFVLGKPLKVKR
ncbi:MAG: conserved repeat domain protein, partial [Phycisphaerales bacterium]|nr:conserved repeat domain protein [Phycisphaerales bacterium]